MHLDLPLLIAIVVPLLLIEGLFSGAEIALLAADRLVLKKWARDGRRGARIAAALVEHPERILSTTLLMTSLCVIGISALITIFLADGKNPGSELLTIAVTSPLVVLFGELLPKTVYRRFATQLAPWVVFPVEAAYWLFLPVTRFLSLYTSRLSRLVTPMEALVTGSKRTTRDELRTLISIGKRESTIKPSEKKMIKRILDFKDAEAKNALIPLVRVDALDERSTVKDALERLERNRHTRVPVYSERIDNIVGILELFDLYAAKSIADPIRQFIKPARYAPETQTLPDLLLEMQREDTEMTVVVDEHGGAVGVITYEDIIEEVVGDIEDEYDQARAEYKVITEHSWLVQARMEIDALNESLRLDLPKGDYKTLGGFLLQQFARIPEPRDELYFQTPVGLLKFTIRTATERRIESVLIEAVQEPGE